MASSGVSRRSGKNAPVHTVAQTVSTPSLAPTAPGVVAVTGKPPIPEARPSTNRNSPSMSSLSPSFSTLIRCSASPRSPVSSHRVIQLFTTSLESLKPRFVGDFRLSGSASLGQSMAQHRSMKHSRCVRGSKAKTRRGRGSTAAARLRADAPIGQGSRATN